MSSDSVYPCFYLSLPINLLSVHKNVVEFILVKMLITFSNAKLFLNAQTDVISCFCFVLSLPYLWK